MADKCEICGKTFSVAMPRTNYQGHTVCKACKARLEAAGSFEKLKEEEEREKERKTREEIERQRKKEEELQRKRVAAEEMAANKNVKAAVYSLDGSRGKHMDVYADKCVITTSVTAGSVITGNATDGEKTIYYIDVIGLQCKKSGLTIGYIQLETASGQMNNGTSNFWGENSFVYDPAMTNITDSEIEEVISYIKYKIDAVKQAQIKCLSRNDFSPADEILKYKKLLDIDAITLDEYNAKKKQLLEL